MRGVVWLVAAALVLVAAFVVVPPLAAGGGYVTVGDNTQLATAFADNLVTSWTLPSGAMTPGMIELVDLWRRWHAIKIVISGLFTAVSGLLASLVWSRFLHDDTGGRRRLGYAGCATLLTVLAVGAVVVVAANIQATAAPLSALTPLLPADPPPGELRDVMAQIRSGLLDSTGAFAQRPALVTLVESQRRYLWALGLTASALAAVFAAATFGAVRMRRAAPPDNRRRRRTGLGFAVGSAVLTATALLAAAATLRSATDPAPSLLAIFTTG